MNFLILLLPSYFEDELSGYLVVVYQRFDKGSLGISKLVLLIIHFIFLSLRSPLVVASNIGLMFCNCFVVTAGNVLRNTDWIAFYQKSKGELKREDGRNFTRLLKVGISITDFIKCDSGGSRCFCCWDAPIVHKQEACRVTIMMHFDFYSMKSLCCVKMAMPIT